MRVLQVGGGSMGTRRMRDLSAQPGTEVRLVDPREDRRASARDAFGVAGFASLAEGLEWSPEVLVVSTPPHLHVEPVRAALEHGIHLFCEADIWPMDVALAESASADRGITVAPSATLLFQPVIREVKRILDDELGRVHAFGYVLSVDEPSWHPHEGEEYYARHRATAPAREMVAFELIALRDLFGDVASVSGRLATRGVGRRYEDTYALQLETIDASVGQLSVLMASPQVARRGWVAGEAGFVAFDLFAGTVQRAFPGRDIADERVIAQWGPTLESVYATEISRFLDAVRGDADWPFPPAASANVCGALAAAELSMLSGHHEPVLPGLRPAELPDGYPVG